MQNRAVPVTLSVAFLFAACGGGGDLGGPDPVAAPAPATRSPAAAQSASKVRSPLVAAEKSIEEARAALAKAPSAQGNAQLMANLDDVRRAIVEISALRLDTAIAFSLFEQRSAAIEQRKVEVEQEKEMLQKAKDALEARETLFRYGIIAAVLVFAVSLMTMCLKWWTVREEVRLNRLLIKEKLRDLAEPRKLSRRRAQTIVR